MCIRDSLRIEFHGSDLVLVEKRWETATYWNSWTSARWWANTRMSSLFRSALAKEWTRDIVTIIALTHVYRLNIHTSGASIVLEMTMGSRSKDDDCFLANEFHELRYVRISDAIICTKGVLFRVDRWTRRTLTFELTVRSLLASAMWTFLCVTCTST